jgi:hypothetical protein
VKFIYYFYGPPCKSAPVVPAPAPRFAFLL